MRTIVPGGRGAKTFDPFPSPLPVYMSACASSYVRCCGAMTPLPCPRPSGNIARSAKCERVIDIRGEIGKQELGTG